MLPAPIPRSRVFVSPQSHPEVYSSQSSQAATNVEKPTRSHFRKSRIALQPTTSLDYVKFKTSVLDRTLSPSLTSSSPSLNSAASVRDTGAVTAQSSASSSRMSIAPSIMALPKPRHTISYNLNEYEKYHYYYLTYGLGKDRAAFGPYSNLTAKHASTQGSRHSSASEKDKQIAPVTSTVDPTTAGTRYTTRGRVKPVTDPSAPSSSSGAGHQVAPVVPPKPKGGKGKGKDVGNDKSVTHSDKKGSSMPPPPVPAARTAARRPADPGSSPISAAAVFAIHPWRSARSGA